MKKLSFFVLLIIVTLPSTAQQKGKIRVGLDFGLGLPNIGYGISSAIDLRYNIFDNWNAGLRVNYGMLNKDLYFDSNMSSTTTELVLSIMGVSDYYFNKQSKSLVPFLGIGLGQNYFQNIKLIQNKSSQIIGYGVDIDNKWGGVLRGGFETKHFRMALEYYLIPASELVNAAIGTNTGITKNSYANLTVGFYLGGGKWKR